MKTYKYLAILVILCVIGMIGIMAFGVARGDKAGAIPKISTQTLLNKLDSSKENKRHYYKTSKGVYSSEYNGVSNKPYTVCFKANGSNKWKVIVVNGNTPIESILRDKR